MQDSNEKWIWWNNIWRHTKPRTTDLELKVSFLTLKTKMFKRITHKFIIWRLWKLCIWRHLKDPTYESSEDPYIRRLYNWWSVKNFWRRRNRQLSEEYKIWEKNLNSAHSESRPTYQNQELNKEVFQIWYEFLYG